MSIKKGNERPKIHEADDNIYEVNMSDLNRILDQLIRENEQFGEDPTMFKKREALVYIQLRLVDHKHEKISCVDLGYLLAKCVSTLIDDRLSRVTRHNKPETATIIKRYIGLIGSITSKFSQTNPKAIFFIEDTFFQFIDNV